MFGQTGLIKRILIISESGASLVNFANCAPMESTVISRDQSAAKLKDAPVFAETSTGSAQGNIVVEQPPAGNIVVQGQGSPTPSPSATPALSTTPRPSATPPMSPTPHPANGHHEQTPGSRVPVFLVCSNRLSAESGSLRSSISTQTPLRVEMLSIRASQGQHHRPHSSQAAAECSLIAAGLAQDILNTREFDLTLVDQYCPSLPQGSYQIRITDPEPGKTGALNFDDAGGPGEPVVTKTGDKKWTLRAMDQLPRTGTSFDLLGSQAKPVAQTPIDISWFKNNILQCYFLARPDALLTLEQMGITAISLDYDPSYFEEDRYGNQIRFKSVIKTSDNRLHVIFDLWFAVGGGNY